MRIRRRPRRCCRVLGGGARRRRRCAPTSPRRPTWRLSGAVSTALQHGDTDLPRRHVHAAVDTVVEPGPVLRPGHGAGPSAVRALDQRVARPERSTRWPRRPAGGDAAAATRSPTPTAPFAPPAARPSSASATTACGTAPLRRRRSTRRRPTICRSAFPCRWAAASSLPTPSSVPTWLLRAQVAAFDAVSGARDRLPVLPGRRRDRVLRPGTDAGHRPRDRHRPRANTVSAPSIR